MPTSQIYEVAAVLTDAQIKALPTTPFQIIAGIPGKILRFWSADVFIDVRAGIYTNIDESMSMTFAYASGNTISGRLVEPGQCLADTGTVYVLEVGGLLSLTSGAQVQTIGNQAGLADAVGQAINIKSANGILDNFTGGHVDNRIHVTLFYTISDVPET